MPSIKCWVTRFLVVLSLLGLFTAVTYRLHGGPRQGVDDADITLVYATNLGQGHGFVYNQGGERVEGFTSALWTVTCALVGVVASSPETALLLLSLLLVATTNTAVTLFLDRQWSHEQPHSVSLSPLSILYLGLICASPWYITWMTITLMDTALWGALLALSVLWIVIEPMDNDHGGDLTLSTLVGLMVLSRPEALLVVPLLLAVRVARHVGAARSGPAIVKSLALTCASFVAVATVVTMFRLWYFGYPLPNTYYAKISPDILYNLRSGLRYLRQYITSTPLVTVAVFLCLAALWKPWTPPGMRRGCDDDISVHGRVDPVTSIACISLVMLAVPVLNGGDHFPWFRFYQPVYPLLAMVFVLKIARLAKVGLDGTGAANSSPLLGSRGFVTAVIGFAFLVVTDDVGWLGLRETPPLSHEFDLSTSGRRLGAELARAFRALPELPSIGVVTAGGFKIGYPGTVIDLMGLNNVAMGHSPGDRRGMKNHAAFSVPVFYQLQPDIVDVSLESQGQQAKPTGELTEPDPSWEMRVPLRRLNEDSRFRKEYAYAWARQRGPAGEAWVTGYFRKPFLANIEQSGLYDVRVANSELDGGSRKALNQLDPH